MPFFAHGNSLGGGGVNRKFRITRQRFSGILEFFSVFYSNNNINLSSFTKIESLDLFTITNGNGGSSGSPGGGAGGSGGSSGIVKFTTNPYGGVPGASIGSVSININPSAPSVSGPVSPGSSLSVPSPIKSNFPGFTFTSGSAGSNGAPGGDGWAGGGGGGGAGGINISHPTITIPSVSGNTGGTGGSASSDMYTRPGGNGGQGGSGYGAGGGGGGGGGEADGNIGGGAGGASGAPGIIIAKVSYRDIEDFFF